MDSREIEFNENEVVTIQYQRLMNFIVTQEQFQHNLEAVQKKLYNLSEVLVDLVSNQSDIDWQRVVAELGRDSVNIIIQNVGAGDTRPIIRINHAPDNSE